MLEYLPQDLMLHVLDFASFRYQVASSCPQCSSVTLWGSAGPRQSLGGDGGEVGGIRFFPLGDRAVTWSRAGAAVWDTASGKVVRKLRHPMGPVECAEVMPGGDRAVTCSKSGGCVVWDVASGEALRVFSAARAATPLNLSTDIVVKDIQAFPDGRRVLTRGYKTSVIVWDIASGEKACECKGHSFAITTATVFPTSDRIITGSFDQMAIIWNVSTCSAIHTFRHAQWVTSVAVLRKGDQVATAATDGTLRFWDASGGQLLRELHIPGSDSVVFDVVYKLVPFPEDDRLATIDRDAVLIWNVTSGSVLHRLARDRDTVWGVAVSPGGDILATCNGQNLTVWDARSGEPLQTLVEPSMHRVEPRPGMRSCVISIGLGRVSDPQGFGRGLPWNGLP